MQNESSCSVPGCGNPTHHAASDFCAKHVHEARCFDVVAVDRADPSLRRALVVIAVSDDDAKRVAFTRLLQRSRGVASVADVARHWSIASVAEMALLEEAS